MGSLQSPCLLPLAQIADSLPGGSLRCSANCVALTHCYQLHTWLVGQLAHPVGFCIFTPVPRKPFLACSPHASAVYVAIKCRTFHEMCGCLFGFQTLRNFSSNTIFRSLSFWATAHLFSDACLFWCIVSMNSDLLWKLDFQSRPLKRTLIKGP